MSHKNDVNFLPMATYTWPFTLPQVRQTVKFGQYGLISLALFVTGLPIAAYALTTPVLPKSDLRADVNRDGKIYLGSGNIEEDDKRGQSYWTIQRGAIVLANLDDDANRCNKDNAIRKLSVSRCNDTKDTVVNGPGDLADLAPLKLLPWPQAPESAWGVVRIGAYARGKARVFIKRLGEWQLLPGNNKLTAQEIRSGVDLRLEALDIVRDRQVWDGRIEVIASVSDGQRTTHDIVRFQVAPLIVQSDISTLKKLYVPGMPWGQDDPGSLSVLGAKSKDASPSFKGYLSILEAANPSASTFAKTTAILERLGLLGSAYKAFIDDFVLAADAAESKPKISRLSTFEDPWVQDMFEMAYAAVPTRGKPHLMYYAIRSPQPQRQSARLPLVEVLGPNVGIIEQWADDSGALPKNGNYSMNSTGNFGAIPPYTHKGKNYPLGRLLYGGGETWVLKFSGIFTKPPINGSSVGLGELVRGKRLPDPSFVRMLRSQAVQKPVLIDTAWLSVGHIDEIVAFVPAQTPRGWKVVVADPEGAWKILTDLVSQNQGGNKFLSKLEPWASGIAPEELDKTVADVVNAQGMAQAQLTTSAKIRQAIRILKAETGITDADLIKVPVLFEPNFFNKRNFIAKTPNAANLVVMDKDTVAVAKQHGPLFNGGDVFENAINSAFADAGLTVNWVEDYIQAHGGDGEIHCQSNALRDPGALAKWWPDQLVK